MVGGATVDVVDIFRRSEEVSGLIKDYLSLLVLRKEFGSETPLTNLIDGH